MAKKRRGESDDEKKLQQDLEEMKRILADLRVKLGMTKTRDLTKIPAETAKRIGDTASEVVKSASEVVEKALKVVQFAALGAMQGARRALKEDKETEGSKTTTKSRRKAQKSHFESAQQDTSSEG